jgi:hypothetical protein
VLGLSRASKSVILDGAGWQTKEDVYDAFFRCNGRAPVWHGRSFDALNDSMVGGSINQVEIPYRLLIKNDEGSAAGSSE